MSYLPKVYDHKIVDNKWYQFWEDSNCFSAAISTNDKRPTYCIILPPPNITGTLHMGHALVNTLQDILIRWKRMLQYNTLWVPGLDHAGIATQTIVEKHLISTYGKRRKDYSREEFLDHIWDWKKKNEQKIINQLKKLGCSCDWSHLRFTMDEKNNRAVKTIFKKMYADGLIYRGDYLVNWDTITETALADDEVEYEERQSHLWYFRYPYDEGTQYLVIATTRPETMLGDTAVAVNPKDQRYAHLIGKQVDLPLTNRKIPIIADHHVDPEYGTGIVKITPAHDPNDYQIGINHNLPFINIMTPNGCINENGGAFTGLTMSQAREAVIEKMQSLDLIEKIEPHMHRVGLSYRSKAIIEPYMSKQWFVRMDSFAKRLKSIAENKTVKFIPSNWINTYLHWINNLRDWCISRQLWWGHRIPIWYRKDNPEDIICFDGEGLPPQVAAEPDAWQQDNDVLDTWFSSALWPFSTLGWPDNTETLTKFYPNSVLVTGHDILFFWVARMIFMGDYVMGDVPFAETFLHGLIYGKSYWRVNESGDSIYVSPQERADFDSKEKAIPKDVHEKWEKMSKSKGNIIDPLEIIEQYGTDAIRMTLCVSAPQSSEIDLDRRRFDDFKSFTNKIWNGARFIFMNLEEEPDKKLPALDAAIFSEGIEEKHLRLEDKWILSSLNSVAKDVNEALTSYELDRAALRAYDFFWKEFCAYYVEISKPILFGKLGSKTERTNKQKLLVITLCQILRLLHPFAPFITEELFQLLKKRFQDSNLKETSDPYTRDTIQALQNTSCMLALYPQVTRETDINKEVNHVFRLMEEVIYAIRNIRGEMRLGPGIKSDLYIIGDMEHPEIMRVKDNINIVTSLVPIHTWHIVSQLPSSEKFGSTTLLENIKIFIPLSEELREKEIIRLQKEQERLEKKLEKTQQQLDNQDFIKRAPEDLVKQRQHTFNKVKEELSQITDKLIQLNC